MIQNARIAFVVVLSSGPLTVRPGDSFDSAQYTAEDYAALNSAAPPNGFVPFIGPATTQALLDAVELRLRGGDVNGYYQASQSLIDEGLLVDC